MSVRGVSISRARARQHPVRPEEPSGAAARGALARQGIRAAREPSAPATPRWTSRPTGWTTRPPAAPGRDIDQRMVELLRVVDLEETIFELGLHQPRASTPATTSTSACSPRLCASGAAWVSRTGSSASIRRRTTATPRSPRTCSSAHRSGASSTWKPGGERVCTSGAA